MWNVLIKNDILLILLLLLLLLLLLFSLTQFEWDFKTDESFKAKMASVTSKFCNENRTECALKESRRKR